MRVIKTALEDSGGNPEEKTRRKFGDLLKDVGWAHQDQANVDPRVSNSITIRDLSIDTGLTVCHSFVDQHVVGIIDAKIWVYGVRAVNAVRQLRLGAAIHPGPTLERALSFRKPRTKVA